MNNENIKKKAFSGAIWKFMERICAQGVSLLVSIIIARILVPEDYSVVSIVTIFFAFANVFISGGFNTALIQKKNADKEDYSSVLYLSLGISAIIYAALFFTAPYIAKIYEQPLLIPVLRVMSLILPVNALKSVLCAYISATLQFKKFFYATIGGTVISAVVGITMGIYGFGAWALVAQQMTNTVIDTVILWITTKLTFSLKVSLRKLKGLFSYGWKILTSSMLKVVYEEVNPLFIGLKFTGADLAYYSKGKNFPAMLTSTCNNTLSAVLFPVMSRYQDDKEQLLAKTRRFIRTSSYILFPAMLGFLAVADTFVQVLLTEKWMPAADYIKIFCVANMFDVIHTGNCETIKAMGRSDIFLKMEIIKKTSYFAIIGLFMLFSDSPTMLAMSAVACTVVAIIVNSIPNIKLLGYRVKYQIYDIIPNLLIAIIMCIITIVIALVPMNSILKLFVQVLIGGFSYIGLSIITKNESFRYLLEVARSMLKKKNND